jgi:hypothetical protein
MGKNIATIPATGNVDAQSFTKTFIADRTGYLAFYSTTAGGWIEVDEVSVKEEPTIEGGTFTEGSTDWFSWEFRDVEVHPANQYSHIEVVANDFSGNHGNDEILVFSTEPPPGPSVASLITTHSCSATSTDVEYVRLRIYSTDTDINHYEIYKDGNFLIAPFRTGNEIFYYDYDVSKGNSYVYEVVSVNSDWDFDIKSATSSRLINLEDDSLCAVPEVTFFVNEIDCSLPNSPSIDFRIRSEGWSGKIFRFEILDKLTGNVVHSSEEKLIWSSGSTYLWTASSTSGLDVGSYEYEARVCFGAEGSGGECSVNKGVTTGDSLLAIDPLTCVPPDTSFWQSTTLWEDLMEVMCVVNNSNSPVIEANFTVEREFPEGVRPFDTFKIYEREYSAILPDPDDMNFWDEIGSCAVTDDETAIYYCHEEEYERVPAHYQYMVRGYNSESGWFGEPGYIELQIMECDGGWFPPPATTTLVCTENAVDDFREAHISLGEIDRWYDPATIIRFYKCTLDEEEFCEENHFTQLYFYQLFDEGMVAIDYGPADSTTHWYALEACKWNDDSNCTGLRFGFLTIEQDACVPQTPIVIEKNANYAVEPSCYPPGSTESNVDLSAVSNNSSELVYINIYRDGVLIASNLEQGEVYTDVVENENTYTYGFEACYPPADVPCGDIAEEDFTVVENFCNPTIPTHLTLNVYCNDLGQIASSTLTTFGSEYHDGYVMERNIPALPIFSTSTNSNEAFTSGEVYNPPISSFELYTYRSRSFRDALFSDWYTRNFNLDPVVSCEPPFALTSSENSIVVSIIGGGPKRSSTATRIGVDPVEAFTSSVNFDLTQIEVELLSPMTNVGVTSEDVDVYLSRDILHSPYDQDLPILSVEIPDKDYLGSNEAIHGANITVKGESEGFETDISIPLIIRWESGSLD